MRNPPHRPPYESGSIWAKHLPPVPGWLPKETVNFGVMGEFTRFVNPAMGGY